MGRTFALALILAAAAAPALAVEHAVVRWKKTGQCEIVTRLPMWGDHWVVLGEFDSRAEAERGLARSRIERACPASKSAKRAVKPPEDERPTVLHRTPTDDRRREREKDVLYRGRRTDIRQ